MPQVIYRLRNTSFTVATTARPCFSLAYITRSYIIRVSCKHNTARNVNTLFDEKRLLPRRVSNATSLVQPATTRTTTSSIKNNASCAGYKSPPTHRSSYRLSRFPSFSFVGAVTIWDPRAPSNRTRTVAPCRFILSSSTHVLGLYVRCSHVHGLATATAFSFVF